MGRSTFRKLVGSGTALHSVRLCDCSLPLSQGRLFSYSDTHRHRLGANYHQIPVNCPYATRARNYQRDGPMCVDGNQGVCLVVCVGGGGAFVVYACDSLSL